MAASTPLDPPEPLQGLPTGVLSLQHCPDCGSRNVVCDMGPHSVDFRYRGEVKESGELKFPFFQCAGCSQSWTDWRANKVRQSWQLERLAKYYGT